MTPSTLTCSYGLWLYMVSECGRVWMLQRLSLLQPIYSLDTTFTPLITTIAQLCLYTRIPTIEIHINTKQQIYEGETKTFSCWQLSLAKSQLHFDLIKEILEYQLYPNRQASTQMDMLAYETSSQDRKGCVPRTQATKSRTNKEHKNTLTYVWTRL
jgi:hypothetical protein